MAQQRGAVEEFSLERTPSHPPKCPRPHCEITMAQKRCQRCCELITEVVTTKVPLWRCTWRNMGAGGFTSCDKVKRKWNISPPPFSWPPIKETGALLLTRSFLSGTGGLMMSSSFHQRCLVLVQQINGCGEKWLDERPLAVPSQTSVLSKRSDAAHFIWKSMQQYAGHWQTSDFGS